MSKSILKIIKAIYFDPSLGPQQGTDVTIEVSSKVNNNQLIYDGSYNRIFPDHFEGVRKKLRIELEYNGKKDTKQYDEDEKINLPADLGMKNERWWEKTSVQIVVLLGAIAGIIALFLLLAPPINEESHIVYMPRVIFYDNLGKPIENKPGEPSGGPLEDFSKIMFLLSTKLAGGDDVKIKFISSRVVLLYNEITKEIHKGALKQEYVLFVDREITADIFNFDPAYLLELHQLNPDTKINFQIIVTIDLIEPATDKKLKEKEIYVACKNVSNFVSVDNKNNNLSIFYPSCLVAKVVDI